MSIQVDQQNKLELHQIVSPNYSSGDMEQLPFRTQTSCRSSVIISIGEQDETVWVTVDPQTNRVRVATPDQPPLAGFRFVPRPINPLLAMISRDLGVLVDSVPALPFSILTPKSLVVLSDNCRCFVTKRVTPYIGPPTEEMIRQGLKCTFCGIPLSLETDEQTGVITRVIVHECGAVYHFETTESHPDVPPDDLLSCREKVRNCLACPRVLNESSYLVWNPLTDSRLAN